MNRTLSRFERTVFGVLTLVSAALFLYLFGYSLLRTAVFDPADLPSEHVIYVADQVLWGLLGMGGLTLLCRLLLRFEKRICLKAFTTVCLSLTFILGCAWVLLARAVPINDTGILYYTAAELSRGNVAELWRHETYLRAYPHQAGFLQYSEALQRLLGRGCNLPMGLLNAVYLTGACGALLMLTWQSLHDRRVQLVTALLLTLFVQPLLYTTFLYGNLPGLCLALWAIVCVQRVVQGGSRWYGAVACALMAAAVILKPNYLIFALAAALVLGVYAIGARRWGSLMLAMLLLIAPAVGGRAAQWVLQKRTGFDLGSGAPQTTWLAMGMQEGPRAPGWYNRYTLGHDGQNRRHPRAHARANQQRHCAAHGGIPRRSRLCCALLPSKSGIAVGGNNL